MSDWARERAIELAERYGPLTVASARPADEGSIKAFAQGMGDWHRRAENAILATLRDADQRARTEERKAIVARLREPDEALVEAAYNTMTCGLGFETDQAIAHGIIRTIADVLDPSPPDRSTNDDST